jgi:hypothetical protein
MVITQKASEKNVGYRGSESVLVDRNFTVKEQRVNGSLCVNHHLMHIRCTLMGFERNYQAKNLSNLIIQRRLYYKQSEKGNNLTINNKHICAQAIIEP